MNKDIIIKLAAEAEEKAKENISRWQALGAHIPATVAAMPFALDGGMALFANGMTSADNPVANKRFGMATTLNGVSGNLLKANALYTLAMGKDVNENVHRGINVAALGAALAGGVSAAKGEAALNPNMTRMGKLKAFGRYAAGPALWFGVNEALRAGMRRYNEANND